MNIKNILSDTGSSLWSLGKNMVGAAKTIAFSKDIVSEVAKHQMFIPTVLFGAAMILSPEVQIGAAVGLASFSVQEIFEKIIGNNSIKVKKFSKTQMAEIKEQFDLFIKQYRFMVMTGPIIEEVVFRGFFQTALSAAVGQSFGLIVSSLAFAYGHLSEGGWDQCIACGFKGLAWGLLKNQYGLISSIAAHIFNNAVATESILAELQSKISPPPVPPKTARHRKPAHQNKSGILK